MDEENIILTWIFFIYRSCMSWLYFYFCIMKCWRPPLLYFKWRMLLTGPCGTEPWQRYPERGLSNREVYTVYHIPQYHNTTVRLPSHHTRIMVGTLEEELIRVVRTLEELQHKYLELLEDDNTTEDPGETLRDYQVLSEKMLEWIKECDNVTR